MSFTLKPDVESFLEGLLPPIREHLLPRVARRGRPGALDVMPMK